MDVINIVNKTKQSLSRHCQQDGIGFIDNATMAVHLDFFKWSILYFAEGLLDMPDCGEADLYRETVFSCEPGKTMKQIQEQGDAFTRAGSGTEEMMDSVVLAMSRFADAATYEGNLARIAAKLDWDKYVKLKNHTLYMRKIHESYYFASPFLFLYWVIKASEKSPFLDEAAIRRIREFQLEAYHQLDELHSYEIALLLLSTLDTVDAIKQQAGLGELIRRYQDKGSWDAEPVYFNSLLMEKIEGGFFARSRQFVEAVCLKSLTAMASRGDIRIHARSAPQEKTVNLKELALFSKIQASADGVISLRMSRNCMEPVLCEGDVIQVDTRQLGVKGQIIAFRYHNGRILAHQVLEVLEYDQESVWVTTALNGGLWGYPVFREDYIGRVMMVSKEEGSVVSL